MMATGDRKHYLGIDFGTSNSYFCLTAENVLSAVPVVIDGVSAIATAILYETGTDGEERVVAFGDRAIEEWGLRSEAERRRCRLSTLFKPDIGYSDPAFRDARSFLTIVSTYMKDQGILPPTARDTMTVIIGSPAIRGKGFEQRLMEIAESLDVGQVRLTAEPVGALINHVATRNDITPGEARRGILVIDFGGGTCDIAYMLRLDVKAAWGDLMLGGRLFDDLFFQWFLESNPDAASSLSGSGDDYYVHWIACREMKERFSSMMERSRANRFSHHIHVAAKYYGGLHQVSWEQFEQRARTYRPCEFLSGLMAGTEHSAMIGPDGRIDLLDWFKRVLLAGLQRNDVKPEMIQYVILTGGSSAWPFVRETVTQVLKLAPGQLFYSASPMTAVGEGIALLPVIQGLHARASKKIRIERAGKLQEIEEHIGLIARESAESLAREISETLVDDEIRRVLSDFSRTGGATAGLYKRIDEVIARNRIKSEALIRRNESEILTAINREILEILERWFHENGMRSWSADRHYLRDLGIAGPAERRLDLNDPLFDVVRTITGLIMTFIAGNLLGGSGLALMAAGLPGLIVGMLMGAGVSFAGLTVLRKPVTRFLSRIQQPAWLASRILSDKRLDSMIAGIRRQIHSGILSQTEMVFEGKIEELKPVIDEFLDDVIEDLSALDHL